MLFQNWYAQLCALMIRDQARHAQAMNDRRARNKAQDAMVQDRRTGESSWACCGWTCTASSEMHKHIAIHHKALLDRQLEEQPASTQPDAALQEIDGDTEFKSRRAEKHGSDPINLSCLCDPLQGTVILFYTYVPISDPLALARLHKAWSVDLGLCGKVKVALEGINATLAGSPTSVTRYIDDLTSLPDFKPLGLARGTSSGSSADQDILERSRYKFFKPTAGCRHVFGEKMSIKIVEEICPLGAPELSVYHDPANKGGKLPPPEFHRKLKELEGRADVVVLDVRNYYESSIGRFKGAITPPIRKFSSFRDYVDRNKDQFSGKTILSYCTGGIRCEKATSYLRQSLEAGKDMQPAQVLMLEGGIHNYLEWVKEEGSAKESLWLGKNYIFDARQSLGLEGAATAADPSAEEADRLISFCQGCKAPCARYVKCDGFGCHRLIISCMACSPAGDVGKSEIFCCDECRLMGDKVREYVLSGQESGPGSTRVKRGICRCERDRRIALGVEK